MAQDFIPDSEFKPDSSSAQGGSDFIPDSEFKPDATPDTQASSSAPADFVPDSEFKPDDSEEPPQSLGRQIGAGAEGLAQGFAGPAATAAELGLSALGVPGLSAEDQAKRASDFPLAHGAGEATGLGLGMFTGASEVGLAANVAEHFAPEAATVLGKIGSGVLRGAISNGLIQTGDEMSKAMLGQGDPEAPVSSALVHIGAAGLLGGTAGGAFGATSAGLAAANNLRMLDELKLGSRLQNVLTGIGRAAGAENMPARTIEKFSPDVFTRDSSKDFQLGQDLYNKYLPQIIKKASDVAVGYGVERASRAMSGDQDSPMLDRGLGIAAAIVLGPKIESLVGKTLIPAAQKLVVPLVINALSKGETSGMFSAIDHATAVAKGAQKMNRAVGNIFSLGSQRVVDEEASDKDREKIKKYIDAGGINKQIDNQVNQPPAPQGFSDGGMVAPALRGTSGIETHFPSQAILMAAAKGRVSNYLGSLKPQKNIAKLPYDADRDQQAQEKKYNKAIDIAASPLSILNKVKDGSLTPEELGHFHQMYPDIHNQLSKQITKKISEQQLSGEMPHYHTRQGLSMFLGASLDSSFNPQNIQAAQNVFAQKAAQQQQAVHAAKSKKGTSKMGEMAKQFKTSEQAAQDRQVEGR